MPRTIRQLMKNTPQSRKEKAKVVRVKDVKIRKNADGFPMVLMKTASLMTPKGDTKKSGDQTNYVSTIEVYPKQMVIVSCSCDDFKYRMEWFLNKVGAARIEYSNGEKPTIRAGEGGEFLCGHLYAGATYLITKGKL